ncbi:MAG: ribosome small subunit-dependent GTPase A [Dehalococcoidia bacterium]|jgi:ribosome biogenesis GTPase
MNEDIPVVLKQLGWNVFFGEAFRGLESPDWVPARVTNQQKGLYTVRGEAGEMKAAVAGRLRYRAGGNDIYPVVGDWVAVLPEGDRAVVRAVLPRKSSFSRKISGGRDRTSGGNTQEQVVASNIDTVFLVSGLDGGRNFNLRSIERYLTVAWNSGAQPVIVLNKSDVCDDVTSRVNEAESIAAGVPVYAVSAVQKTGMDKLKIYLTEGNTVALLGRSGVGKSALINAMLGEDRLQVGAVREKDLRGRHTTTYRELIILPDGGVVIDTPGMRELQLWGEEDSLDDAFDDIESVARGCRFSDCSHSSEPGCAVREAIEKDVIDESRFQSYLKLKRELKYLAARRDDRVRIEEKDRWKKISRWAKQLKKNK